MVIIYNWKTLETMLPICIYIVQSYFGVLYFYHLLSSLPQIQKQFHFAAPRDFQETF